MRSSSENPNKILSKKESAKESAQMLQILMKNLDKTIEEH